MRAASLYIGAGLHPYLRACLQSWTDHGHEIDLYTYDAEIDVPRGVVRRDANEIIGSDRVFTYRRGDGSGSVAAFANEFRYRLLASRPVTWVDTDVLCLSGAWPDDDHLFGWETADHTKLNNAVLRLPADSSVLAALLAHAEGADRGELAWGETGPVLLTRLIDEAGLAQRALSPAALYAIHFSECRMLVDPAARADVTRRLGGALAVHLWDEIWTRQRIPTFLRPPPGSFLADALARHQIGVPIDATFSDLSIFEYRASTPTVPKADFDDLAAWAHSLEADLLARNAARRTSPSRRRRN